MNKKCCYTSQQNCVLRLDDSVSRQVVHLETAATLSVVRQPNIYVVVVFFNLFSFFVSC